MSRFLITQGVGHFIQNILERWSTIVCYKLADYKLNKFLETNKIYYKLQYWFELHHLHVYINSSDIKALFGTRKRKKNIKKNDFLMFGFIMEMIKENQI